MLECNENYCTPQYGWGKRTLIQQFRTATGATANIHGIADIAISTGDIQKMHRLSVAHIEDKSL